MQASFTEPNLPTHSWQRRDYIISTDRSLLDLDVIHGYLTRSYWTPGIPRDVVASAILHSLCFGLYADRQIGFARVVTATALSPICVTSLSCPDIKARDWGHG